MARPTVRPRRLLPALLLSMMLGGPRLAASQSVRTTVVGTVMDASSRLGLAGATVQIGDDRAVTDHEGRFRLQSGLGESDSVRVRRLGYAPIAVSVNAARTGALALALEALPQQLAQTSIVAERTRYTGRLAGYYQRLERKTAGAFITRAQLDQEGAGILSNVLQKVPGVTVMRGRGAPRVSLRGRDCRPLIWLDGMALSAGDIDLDGFAPQTLQGIELYLGPTAPSRFQATSGRSRCGTILLWSRGIDTDPVRPFAGISAEALQQRLNAGDVYRENEVSIAALPPANGIAPIHPQELRATGIAGSVVAEFIVDEQGIVAERDFGVVFATHPDFAHAVRVAVVAARFTPARRDGRPVRQLIRQRFEFPLQ